VVNLKGSKKLALESFHEIQTSTPTFIGKRRPITDKHPLLRVIGSPKNTITNGNKL
jgi:hypothetical protein